MKRKWYVDRYGMMKGWVCCLIIGLIVLAVCIGVGVLSNVLSSGECATYQQRYGLRTHWTMFYGCFMKLPDGHWVDSGSYQAFQEVVR